VTKVNCILLLSLFSSPVNSGGELLLFLFAFLWFYSAWLNQIQSRFAHSPGLLDYLTYEIFYPIGWLITGLEVRTLERVFLSHPYSIFALFTASGYKEENLVLFRVGCWITNSKSAYRISWLRWVYWISRFVSGRTFLSFSRWNSFLTTPCWWAYFYSRRRGLIYYSISFWSRTDNIEPGD